MTIFTSNKGYWYILNFIQGYWYILNFLSTNQPTTDIFFTPNLGFNSATIGNILMAVGVT